MGLKHTTSKSLILIILSLVTSQCRAASNSPFQTDNETQNIQTEVATAFSPNILVTEPSQNGCDLPGIKVSNLIHYFQWSEDGNSIIYNDNNGIWHIYDTVAGDKRNLSLESFATPTPDFKGLDIKDYQEIFISPSRDVVIFTRGTHKAYKIYYKHTNNEQEVYLGNVQGYIKKIDWLKIEKKALIAMDWQSPSGIPEAHIYIIDFSKNELTIEMPKMKDYKNIEYLGLTPDETRLMFVSYLNPVHLDRTIKIWDFSKDEITSTSVFSPLDFKWISESEFISIGYQDPSLFPFASVILYNIDNSTITYLADAKFNITTRFSNSIKISPNGKLVAYIENETNSLYWTSCKY